MKQWTSWNRNIQHDLNNLFCPENEAELVSAVSNAASIRVIGYGKSSADIVGGTDNLISLKKYDRLLSIDESKREVTVQAGMTLRTLFKMMDEHGYTLPALPDIDSITVGGAIATGSHGTGRDAFILSSYMVRCTVIHADGHIRTYSEDNDELAAFRVSLGVLGVLSTITFRCDPTYNIKIKRYPMKDMAWYASYKSLLKNHYFLRILWLPHTDYAYVMTGDVATSPMKKNITPWYLPHVKLRRSVSRILYKISVLHPRLTLAINKILKLLFFSHKEIEIGTVYETTVTKSRGASMELAEWSVPIDKFDDLFLELKEALNTSKNNAYAHIPMDIRFIKCDTTWLSNAYGHDIVTVGCVSRIAENANDYEAFSIIESVFRQYGGRPHWAKRHTMTSNDLSIIYPKWQSFNALRRKLDPHNKFLNPYLKRLFE